MRPDLLTLLLRILTGERPRPASSDLADLHEWQAEAHRLQELEQMGLLDAHLMKTDRYGAELWFISYPILTERGKEQVKAMRLDEQL